jgi:hypothetical protein
LLLNSAQEKFMNSQHISCLDSSLGRASACSAVGWNSRPARDMFVLALSERIKMTLVKSLYSGDPDVIQKHADLQRHQLGNEPGLASAIRPTSQISPCVKLRVLMHWGAHVEDRLLLLNSAQVEVPNSQRISCRDSSLGRASACGAGGRRFAPRPDMFVLVLS